MATNLEVFTERLANQKAAREKFLEEVCPKNYKAALVSCPSCGSKIAKRFFETTNCPLCGESMLSASNKERLASFDKRIATTESNLAKAQASAKKRAGEAAETTETGESTETAEEGEA